MLVSWSPDGKALASASDDWTVRLWEAATGQQRAVLRGHTREVTSVSWSPDGKPLTSASGEVKVWDAATGEELLTRGGHKGRSHGVAFSPDGHRLASFAADGRVKVWDATLPPAGVGAGRPVATR